MSWSATPIDPDVRLIDDILRYMTLEERLGQLRLLDLSDNDRTPEGTLRHGILEQIREGQVSAIANVRDAREASELQTIAVEGSRSGVPLLLQIRGSAPDWPAAPAARATWEPSSLRDFGRAVGQRARDLGSAFLLLPGNILAVQRGRRPAQADRFAELDKRLSDALVEGLQGARVDGVIPIHSREHDVKLSARSGSGLVLSAVPSGDSSIRPGKQFYIVPTIEAARREHSSSEIEATVRGVLMAKARFGLLRDPHARLVAAATLEKAPYAQVQQAANRLWANSFVLLQNERGVLPLTRDAEDILIVGTHASSASYCNRALAAFGISYRSVSGLAMRPEGESERDRALPPDGLAIGMACDAAQRARTVLLVVDDDDCDAIPGAPAAVLKGPAQTLLRALARDHRRIVFISASRRPVALGDMSRRIAAYLHIWGWPGQRSAEADALFGEILTGQVPPSGRLPFSVPSIGGGKAMPMGFGGSYGNLRLRKAELELAGAHLAFTVKLANTGDFPGAACLQIYVQAPATQSAPPRLRAFRTVTLRPRTRETLTFELGAHELGLHSAGGVMNAEPGIYRIGIGPNAAELVTQDIELTAPVLRALATGRPVDLDGARRA